MIAEKSPLESGLKRQDGSLVGRLVGLLEDHLALLSLEVRYETRSLRKQFFTSVAAGACAFFALICLQAAGIVALQRTGPLSGGLWTAAMAGIKLLR